MAYAAGVDVGSTQTKAVIVDEARRIVSRALGPTGANVVRAAEEAFHAALAAGDLREEEVEYVVGTGYGRYKVTFGNSQVTEISCHGRGAVHMRRSRCPLRRSRSIIVSTVERASRRGVPYSSAASPTVAPSRSAMWVSSPSSCSPMLRSVMRPRAYICRHRHHSR